MLHAYLVLNGAIATAYIITRIISALPFFNRKISQVQRLKFGRYSFFTAVVAFFLIPAITATIPFSPHSNFHLEPVLKNASVTYLEHHPLVNEQITQLGASQSFFSMNIILIFIFLVGFGLFLKNYIKNLVML